MTVESLVGRSRQTRALEKSPRIHYDSEFRYYTTLNVHEIREYQHTSEKPHTIITTMIIIFALHNSESQYDRRRTDIKKKKTRPFRGDSTSVYTGSFFVKNRKRPYTRVQTRRLERTRPAGTIIYGRATKIKIKTSMHTRACNIIERNLSDVRARPSKLKRARAFLLFFFLLLFFFFLLFCSKPLTPLVLPPTTRIAIRAKKTV